MFPNCNFWQEFQELLTQSHICHIDWVRLDFWNIALWDTISCKHHKYITVWTLTFLTDQTFTLQIITTWRRWPHLIFTAADVTTSDTRRMTRRRAALLTVTVWALHFSVFVRFRGRRSHTVWRVGWEGVCVEHGHLSSRPETQQENNQLLLYFWASLEFLELCLGHPMVESPFCDQLTGCQNVVKNLLSTFVRLFWLDLWKHIDKKLNTNYNRFFINRTDIFSGMYIQVKHLRSIKCGSFILSLHNYGIGGNYNMPRTYENSLRTFNAL